MTPDTPNESSAPPEAAPPNPPPADPQQLATVPAPPLPKPSRQTVEIMRMLAERQPETFKTELKSLIEAEMARDVFEQDGRLARMFAISGQFSDIKGESMEQSIASAMVKIQLGRSMSLTPTESMQFIYFTNGRPALQQEIFADRLRRAGYAWDIDWLEETVQHKGKPWQRCIGCRLWLKRFNSAEGKWQPVLDRNGEPVNEAFTEADADHAQVWEKGKQIPLSEKWNFKAWSRDMYFWRTLSRLRKYHVTDVLRGVTIQELADELPPLNQAPIELGAEAMDLTSTEAPAAAPQPTPRKRNMVREQILKSVQPEEPPLMREPGEGE